MKMSVTKRFTFEAAHLLPMYEGPCANLHGHSYVLEVTVAGIIDRDGMVMDFSTLNQIVKPIIGALDHSFLNNVVETPTAENILLWIDGKLKDADLWAEMLTLWETENSYATLLCEDSAT
jgi:6-pyruvoyltetrahydropterin/6-carboxytetrahydropterin synthase